MILKSPYPWFGGKSKVSALVWSRLGDVRNYVEPFFGSGAVLLQRPEGFSGTETINDFDGFVANFWRALQAAPDEVAKYADWPVNENDLHARHSWLVGQRESMTAKLEGDPDYYDAKIAGWWVWGVACWIGSGFCSGKGPWQVLDGQLIHLGGGRGVNRQLIHLGDAGRGVNRKRTTESGLYEYMNQLAERMKRVRVCCGDWSRVCTDTPTVNMGETAVFLDPPYADTAKRTSDLYAIDSESVAHEVREWAIANGERMRICLAGYEGEHAMPSEWECVAWKTSGGYGSQGSQGSLNAHKERLWFSPRCVKPVADKSQLAFTE